MLTKTGKLNGPPRERPHCSVDNLLPARHLLYENVAMVKLVSTTFYLYEISQFTSVCVYVNLSCLIITKPHVVQSQEIDSERLGAEVNQ